MSALIKLVLDQLEKKKSAGKAASAPVVPTTKPPMTFDGGVLKIGKKVAAVALSWNTVQQGESTKSQAEAAVNPEPPVAGDRSARGSFNSYVNLTGANFIGFGSSALGHKRGQVALVTALPPELTGERWVGAFLLSERADLWWLGSVRNGQVFEDRIIAGRSRAEDALRENLAAPDWTAIYAPEEWEVRGAQAKELWQVADMARARPLRDLTPVRTIIPYAIGGATLLAVAIGVFTWSEKRKAEEMRQLEELRRRAEAMVTVRPSDYPFHNIVPMGAFVTACEKAIERITLLVDGWEMQPASCTFGADGEGEVTAGWTRSGGKTAQLIAASPRDWPIFEIDAEGNEASMTLPVQAEIDPESSLQEPWEPGMIQARMRDRFQTLGLDVQLRESTDNQSAAVAAAVFNSHELMIGGQEGLRNYVDILSDVPALHPQAMIYNVASGRWDMVIKIYHPVMLPRVN